MGILKKEIVTSLLIRFLLLILFTNSPVFCAGFKRENPSKTSAVSNNCRLLIKAANKVRDEVIGRTYAPLSKTTEALLLYTGHSLSNLPREIYPTFLNRVRDPNYSISKSEKERLGKRYLPLYERFSTLLRPFREYHLLNAIRGRSLPPPRKGNRIDFLKHLGWVLPVPNISRWREMGIYAEAIKAHRTGLKETVHTENGDFERPLSDILTPRQIELLRERQHTHEFRTFWAELDLHPDSYPRAIVAKRVGGVLKWGFFLPFLAALIIDKATNEQQSFDAIVDGSTMSPSDDIVEIIHGIGSGIQIRVGAQVFNFTSNGIELLNLQNLVELLSRRKAFFGLLSPGFHRVQIRVTREEKERLLQVLRENNKSEVGIPSFFSKPSAINSIYTVREMNRALSKAGILDTPPIIRASRVLSGLYQKASEYIWPGRISHIYYVTDHGKLMQTMGGDMFLDSMNVKSPTSAIITDALGQATDAIKPSEKKTIADESKKASTPSNGRPLTQ